MTTIVALATGQVNCAIHIIRVSGSNCFNIVNKCVSKPLKHVGYHVCKNTIVEEKNVLDEVIILTFIAPHSFTGEDCIEIQCHGGYVLANKIIQLLLKHGAIPAQHGEFTKRAYLNNKISLQKSEAINNIIHANSSFAIKFASCGFQKDTLSQLKKIEKQIFTLISQLEINIDYPEYEDQLKITRTRLKNTLTSINNELYSLITNSKAIQHAAKGLNVVLVGEPNVGKSSLLNALLNTERAIVSPTPGTTRDTIAESILVNGMAINLIDTAGYRKTKDKLESMSIKRTIEAIKNADHIFWIKDCSRHPDNEFLKLLLHDKSHTVVMNKCDLQHKQVRNCIYVSARLLKITPLINQLKKLVKTSSLLLNRNFIQSHFSLSILENCANGIGQCLALISNKQPIDMCLELLHTVYKQLRSLFLNSNEYNFINEMFATFCLGK